PSIPPPPPTVFYSLSLHDALPIWRLDFGHVFFAQGITMLGEPITGNDCFHVIVHTGFNLVDKILGRYHAGFDVFLFVIIAKNTRDRKSTRLNSSHVKISYAVFCLK